MSKLDSFQNLLQFLFQKFGRISYKFAEKDEIQRHFTQNLSLPSIVIQIG